MTSLALEISQPNTPAKPWRLPARGVALFYGCPQVHRLSHYFLPRLLLDGGRVLYLDGANRFDPLLLARLARQRGWDTRPFNENLRVARAFTCFQLTQLLCRAPRLLERFPAQAVVVTALPELYFDEDVREPDAATAFRQGSRALEQLAGRLPVAVFSDPASFSTPRRKFFESLRACAGQVWKFTPAEHRAPGIGNGSGAAPALPFRRSVPGA